MMLETKNDEMFEDQIEQVFERVTDDELRFEAIEDLIREGQVTSEEAEYQREAENEFSKLN